MLVLVQKWSALGDIFTFSIVAEAHLGLPKTNGVFSLRNSIEFLQLGLINTLSHDRLLANAQHTIWEFRGNSASYLAGEIDLDGLDANILRARHCGWR